MPPRRPITCHSSTWRTTWTPRRRSHVRSSKPLLGPRGAFDDGKRAQHCTLRRRSAARELQQGCLVHGAARIPPDRRRNAKGEAATPRRPGHDHARATRLADVPRQCAAVEDVEASTAPPEPQHEQDGCGRPGPRRDDDRRCDGEGHGDHSDPHAVGRREPKAEGAAADLWCATAPSHSATRLRRSASRAGPMPDTASSSSTEPNPPCCWR